MLRPQRKEKYVEAIGSDPYLVYLSRWTGAGGRRRPSELITQTKGRWSVSLRLDRHSEVQIGFAEFSRPGAQLQFLAFCDPTFSLGGLVGTGVLRFWRQRDSTHGFDHLCRDQVHPLSRAQPHLRKSRDQQTPTIGSNRPNLKSPSAIVHLISPTIFAYPNPLQRLPASRYHRPPMTAPTRSVLRSPPTLPRSPRFSLRGFRGRCYSSIVNLMFL